jgi:hypothetical protein
MTKTPPSSSTPTNFLTTENGLLNHVYQEDEFLQIDIITDVPVIVEDTSKLQAASAGMEFLFKAFNYDVMTLAYTPHGRAPRVKFYAQSELQKAISEAYAASKQKLDIYFMVNEGDGSARSKNAIHTLSKFYIDADGCELSKITDYLNSINLQPHLIVESSQGRYHLYFFFEPVEKTHTTENRWSAIQEMLMRLGDPAAKPKDLGLDGSMIDYSKLLRVPGFPHPRKYSLEFPLSKVLTDSTHMPLYTLDELYTVTNAHLRTSLPPNERKDPKPDNFNFESNALIPDGERNTAIYTEAYRLAMNRPPLEAAVLFKDYVLRKVERSDTEFVCNGELTNKALECLKTAFDKKAEKAAEEEKSRVEFIKKTIEQPVVSAWHKPDSFYLNAPNEFGIVTRQMMDTAIKPSAPLSFATALTGRSILRAKDIFTPLGGSCALYTLCVADTGRGKDAPNTILQNTFNYCGYRNLIENEFISSAGIDNHLESNQGIGFWLVDEIGATMVNMQKKGAADYKTEILGKFLKLFSLGNKKGWSSPKKSNTNKKGGNKQIYIDYPRAAILGYTVPSTFNKIFTPESIDIGLLQRFIYVVVPTELPVINKTPSTRSYIHSDLFPVLEGIEHDDYGNCISKLETPEPTEINVKSKPPDRLKWTQEVEADYYDFARSLDEEGFKIISQDPERHREAALYTRIAEVSLRIATTMSVGDTLTMPIWDFAKDMMTSSLKAILQTANEHILAGKGAEVIALQETLVKKVCQMCTEKNVPHVLASTLHTAVQNKFKDSKEFHAVLNQAVEMGRLSYLDVQGARGRIGRAVRVNNVLNE